MANVGPGAVTITSTTGPGVTNTAVAFTRVTNIEVDLIKNTIKITHGDGLTISYYDYSAMATVTWTISGGATTITISS
jgi:hypothetical protein